jgi:outer membrane immunogenic protein
MYIRFMVRPLLIGSTALSGLILSAPVDAFAASPPPYTWTGVYFGLNAGYEWGDNPTSCSYPSGLGGACQGEAFPNLKTNGELFGSTFGADWQYHNWVLGAAADFSVLDLHGSAAFPSVDAGKNGTADQIASRYDWLGTVRGRAGYAIGQSLIYGTGGFAFARVDDQYLNEMNGADAGAFSTSGVRTGWTVGGGVEYALTSNWSVKLEYLHVGLAGTNLDVSGALTAAIAGGGTAAPPPGSVILHFNNSFDLVRAGVNFRW